ncbi:predicted protein [Histoplasma capsulatum H143]|uniref:Uncharacterized protein n=1 Tax=Ajellomyces capsulatus (strain H143) TaxID=544712 RepID=C6HDS1_AJECH|nr:predicted protein [Histoplasma capsulatum H143]
MDFATYFLFSISLSLSPFSGPPDSTSTLHYSYIYTVALSGHHERDIAGAAPSICYIKHSVLLNMNIMRRKDNPITPKSMKDINLAFHSVGHVLGWLNIFSDHGVTELSSESGKMGYTEMPIPF